MSFADAYRGRSVLVTGDTGFKGAWLTRWLLTLGARVTGFALPPERPRDLFVTGDLASEYRHVNGDVRAMEEFRRLYKEARPDVVFHLAAQALVRRAYEQPVETIATNVVGTAHLLECARDAQGPTAVVIVTSDKCYANRESQRGYEESDPLGGDDIYSASKGAAEMVAAAYRTSFFGAGHTVRMATARAGNVIGPGDWADDRLIPDAVRAFTGDEQLIVRNPAFVRPWQHVLEPLSGYLWLGAKLISAKGAQFASAFNFGPREDSCIPVAEAADHFVAAFGGPGWRPSEKAQAFKETHVLRLRIERSAAVLQWRPIWAVSEAIARTARGYLALAASCDAQAVRAVMDAEIDAYVRAAASHRLDWTQSVDRAPLEVVS